MQVVDVVNYYLSTSVSDDEKCLRKLAISNNNTPVKESTTVMELFMFLLLLVAHSRHNFYTGSSWTTYGEITTSRSSPRSENGTSRQSEKGELGGEPHHHTKAKCPRLPYWKHSAYDGGHPSLGSLRLAQKQHS